MKYGCIHSGIWLLGCAFKVWTCEATSCLQVPVWHAGSMSRRHGDCGATQPAVQATSLRGSPAQCCTPHLTSAASPARTHSNHGGRVDLQAATTKKLGTPCEMAAALAAAASLHQVAILSIESVLTSQIGLSAHLLHCRLRQQHAPRSGGRRGGLLDQHPIQDRDQPLEARHGCPVRYLEVGWKAMARRRKT